MAVVPSRAPRTSALVDSWRKNQRVRPGVDSFLGLGVGLDQHFGGEVEASDDAGGALGGERSHGLPGEHLSDGAGVHTGLGALDDEAASGHQVLHEGELSQRTREKKRGRYTPFPVGGMSPAIEGPFSREIFAIPRTNYDRQKYPNNCKSGLGPPNFADNQPVTRGLIKHGGGVL